MAVRISSRCSALAGPELKALAGPDPVAAAAASPGPSAFCPVSASSATVPVTRTPATGGLGSSAATRVAAAAGGGGGHRRVSMRLGGALPVQARTHVCSSQAGHYRTAKEANMPALSLPTSFALC